jgi:hypothetical protein
MVATVGYRFPNTGLNVHRWVCDDPTIDNESESYEQTCTACTRVHLVSPRTGKVLGADDEYRECLHKSRARRPKRIPTYQA